MIAVVSLLLVLTISMVVTRVASVALVHTGMGPEAARFQARSALTGAGFTTNDLRGSLLAEEAH
jgi:Trk-type K+ transport system membrane component